MDARQQNPGLRLSQIKHDLPHLHKVRWARIADELAERIEQATGDERTAIERELDQHYTNRFRPESSRAALLAEVGIEGAH